MQYLCYFISFCMFSNYWRCICRSPESAGKVHVKIPGVQSSENSRKIRRIIFWEISHGAKRAHGDELQGAGATPCRGSTLGRRWGLPLVPVAPLRLSFGVLLTLDLKTSGVSKRNFFAVSTRQKPDREKKSSGREKSAREFPSRRGGIAAIVIAITPAIIGIIISTISTIITATVPSHLVVAIIIVLLLVHWNRIPGIDYHL